MESFQKYDKDNDGYLNRSEFTLFLNELFQAANKKSYLVRDVDYDRLFSTVAKSKGTLMTKDEFENCHKICQENLIKPKSALIVVDVQNDFVDGSLALRHCDARQEALEIIPFINRMIDEVSFDLIVYTYDWHPKDHISFFENINIWPIHELSPKQLDDIVMGDSVIFDIDGKREQRLWPTHCVQDTFGAELHPKLKFKQNSINIYKGTNSKIDSYSAFWDNGKKAQTNLKEELDKWNITDIYVCGVAYDVCVGSTALHGVEYGYKTVVVEDACRGVNNDDIDMMRNRLRENGALILPSHVISNMVKGIDRRPELGIPILYNKLK
ncbi:hypothetical protein SNEBB_009851 [Seison nebaliae]|nr:hypothetical protein SNEBB_009851 [Seison nebaliae]